VQRSTTPFQTERYSRPCHLAASFPFPAQAKNEKNAVAKSPESLAHPVFKAISRNIFIYRHRNVGSILKGCTWFEGSLLVVLNSFYSSVLITLNDIYRQ
jgi:hypothetical protein